MRTTGLLAVAVLLAVSGCISPQFIANKSGFLAGTGYLAVNSPPAEEVAAVKKVIDKVAKHVDQLKPGDTFAKIYGPIKKEIDEELSGTVKIVALSAVKRVLGALDTFFLANPKWAENKDLSIDLTKQFVAGVNQAFDLFARDGEVRASMARLRSASVSAFRAASAP